jgi:glycosyltransferase involved in cell wall biosynthesis
MKVLIAHNRYSSAQPSGENVMVDNEIAQLTAAGIEVIPFLRSSDEIGDLPLGRKLLLPTAPIYSRTATQELAELIEKHHPSLMHLHNPYPLLSPWVVRTAHAHDVPVVQTIHNFRHVCVAATFIRDGHDCHDCFGKRFATPAVKHNCYRGSKAQSAVMATTLAVHRGTWHSVDRFIALTTGIAGFLTDYGIDPDRITVKPNAVPDPGRAPSGRGEGFLYIGRLTPEKGVGLLLEAWQRHPAGSLGTLKLIGDGPMRAEVEAAAAARSDIEFLGLLPHPEALAVIRSAAVVVVPSLWNDVLPTVIIEALANGRPVLGTARGGIPYVIGMGEPAPGGWVVEPTVDALAEALPDALAQADPVGLAARLRYLSKFSPDVVLDQLIEAYRLTMARHAASATS